jgi:hypothetical protein
VIVRLSLAWYRDEIQRRIGDDFVARYVDGVLVITVPRRHLAEISGLVAGHPNAKVEAAK